MSSMNFYFSTASGSSGFSTSSSRTESQGKYMSTTQITTNSLQNLFNNVSTADNTGLVNYYKCIFIYYDGGGSFTSADGLQVSISGASGGVDFYLGKDPLGATPRAQTGAQSVVIANQTTAPTGVTFTQPTVPSPITIASVPDLNVHALWVRLTPVNSVPITGDNATISISYTEMTE
jgi:hypothetical protein